MKRKTKKFKQARAKSLSHAHSPITPEATPLPVYVQTSAPRKVIYAHSDQDLITRKVTQQGTIKTLVFMGLILIAQYLVYLRIDDIKRFFQ